MTDKFPEHEKLHKVAKFSQTCGEFIDWLSAEKGIHLAEWGDSESVGEELYYAHTGVQDLLAEFFGIDRVVLEREKRQMLEELSQA